MKWLEESGTLELARELGITVRYWHVMDSGKDSVDLLTRLLDRFDTKLEYTVVLNQLRGEEFDIFEKSGQRERAVALGAKIGTLARLYEPAMTRMDAHSVSFWAATHGDNRESTGISLLERQRIKIWQGRAYAELGRLGI